MKAHSEEAFEALIEDHLVTHGGYVRGNRDGWDAGMALIAEDLLGFVEETQPKVWEKLRGIHGSGLEGKLLDGFDKATKGPGGVLGVLRHGFKFYGKLVRVATFQPAHGLNPEVEAAYAANRLAVVRQLRHDPKRPKDALDLALFLNGIPVVTAELKNPLTRQNAEDAVRQYREDRDPHAPIFRFEERALVHFALGTDRVRMTTRLAGKGTFFLPFDRGTGTGAGNPPVEGKHRTFYLWEHVWQRDSLMDVLARFIHLQAEEERGPDGKKHTKKTMIFPRYHQLDCVRRLVAAARQDGAGRNYLVQHSTGSGKSNSIAWLAHRLASLHDATDRKVFDSVVVITDRVVLDRQLQDTIFQLDHKQGVVRKIDRDSAQLATALEAGVPILISTLHKFGFIADKIESLPDRRYAVIVDEAHSSQSGEMATDMKDVLAGSRIEAKLAEEDADAPDQAALRAAIARGQHDNLSFFAFTATPKYKTLELFGHKGPEGKPAPFHLYSMRQAIEEGFILDVLRGYTTYKRYFRLVRAVNDDPDVDKTKGAKALARFVSLHPHNVAQKAEVMLEHFRGCVQHRLQGRAKAMVVTSSRLHAVKYKRELDRQIAEKRFRGIGVLVAFSGEVRDDDNPSFTYTEPQMNGGLKESELPRAFAGRDYNLLVVADKYQTGFDQPLLQTMYVDKKLSGIQAVQTLSRLNRKAPGKEETFVLDFVNERDDILDSFQLYYEGTTAADDVDPQRLYELQGKLDAAQVWHASDVDRFARVFFKPRHQQRPADGAAMNAALDPAVDRFKALDEEAAEDFRGRLGAFCNLYGFLAQIVPFTDADLEKRFAFGRMLLRKLPAKGETSPEVDLGEDVALAYYRLEKEAEGALSMVSEGSREVYGPDETGTGTQRDPEFEKLSRLIDVLNDRFGTDFDAQDLIDGLSERMVADEGLQQAARANDRENFRYVFEPALDDALIERHDEHARFIDGLYSNADMLRVFRRLLMDDLYPRLRGEREAEAEAL
ncbi:MAG: type I restriction endonuclease subunit R [Myxococcota bacterium]